jgi:hypothetical protein
MFTRVAVLAILLAVGRWFRGRALMARAAALVAVFDISNTFWADHFPAAVGAPPISGGCSSTATG